MNVIVDALSPIVGAHIDMPAAPERVWRTIRAATGLEPAPSEYRARTRDHISLFFRARTNSLFFGCWGSLNSLIGRRNSVDPPSNELAA